MPVSTELLNTTFQDFKGPLVTGFYSNTPTMAALKSKGRISGEGGAYVERDMQTGSPARGQGIYNGDESLDRTRHQKIVKFRVDFHRVVVSINIPKKEMLQNKGKAGVIKLIDAYPKNVVDGYTQDREKYWLTGKSEGIVFDSDAFYGWLTLNGQFSAGVGTGLANGYLDFRTPAQQTSDAESVQNVTKSQSSHHFNQYGDIPNWATDGVKTLRKVYRACAQKAGKPNSGPDLIIMDDDTYGNYQESKLDLIRLMKVKDQTDKGNMLEDVFGLAAVYSSTAIDLAADFTGVALDGVTYMINTDWLEIVQLQAMTISDFVDGGPDSDSVTAKAECMEAAIFQKTNAHGCVSGGAK